MYITHMRTLKIDIPETVDIDDQEALMILATKFYERGRLSLGQAAELVGLSKRAFMEILANYGVSVFNYSPADLEKDINNA